jgi:hypothetical protein
MPAPALRFCFFLLAFFAIAPAPAQNAQPRPSTTFRLDSLKDVEIINVKADAVTYRGKHAVRLLDSSAQPVRTHPQKEAIAILKNSDFKDGTIEAEIAGAPRQGAPDNIRGFVGIAFRSQDEGSRFECFYVRFTNGRSDDQLRRNHSVQYISSPEFPWERLRKENPGVYESYTDLEPGAWTKIKILVAGAKARLYINGAEQPCLIVNDLKLGDVHGPIALWIGADTEAYFSNLTVK